MLETIFAAAAAFIGTNIDDLLILMVLFSRIDPTVLRQKRRIVAGHSVGLAILTGLSLLGALGLKLLHWRFIGFVGLLPIILGIRAILELRKGDGEGHDSVYAAGFLASMLLTLANGADNVGVYMPLFMHYGNGERLFTVLVFAAMNFLWCFIGFAIIKLPRVQKCIHRLGGILLPIILILIGIYILYKNEIFLLFLS
ncbi:MAG: cadmium resistance transporter [Clostridia bacterium]|nr:cadmium resistance transporter [Clostridia bacterium]